MKRAVLDASVVLKWYLLDKELGPPALGLLEQYITGNLEIIAPSLMEYELLNGLVIAGHRGRIEEKEIRLALEGFQHLGLHLGSMMEVYPTVIRYCRNYRCSVYDGAYLAPADLEEIDLITADDQLYRRVKKNLSWVKGLSSL